MTRVRRARAGGRLAALLDWPTAISKSLFWVGESTFVRVYQLGSEPSLGLARRFSMILEPHSLEYFTAPQQSPRAFFRQTVHSHGHRRISRGILFERLQSGEHVPAHELRE